MPFRRHFGFLILLNANIADKKWWCVATSLIESFAARNIGLHIIGQIEKLNYAYVNIVEKTFFHIHIGEEDFAQGSVPLCFEKKLKEKPKSNYLNIS